MKTRFDKFIVAALGVVGLAVQEIQSNGLDWNIIIPAIAAALVFLIPNKAVE